MRRDVALATSFGLPAGVTGVLPSQWLELAVAQGVIGSERYRIPRSSIQPASVDLRLGETAYRLRCSFLPEGERIEAKLTELSMGQIDLRDGAILERNRPYLVPLIEELDLPPGLSARTNPRSSTGRLDIFTRVITDEGHSFDEVPPGYRGRLYLELVSRSFTVFVRTELSLNQLRLQAGKSRRDDPQVVAMHAAEPILFSGAAAVPAGDLVLGDGLFLSVDLLGEAGGRVGFRAKKNSQLLDLTKRNHYDPDDFWEPVHHERGNRLVLEPEEFYLLISKERVRIPPEYSAEMTAYDPTSGELRTHYAGFFDPGFGHTAATQRAPGEQQGSKAVMEVRAHDVPFMLQHGQRVAKLVFEELSEAPSILYGQEIGSSYQHQERMLSKHFAQQQGPPFA
ncbi:MAG TPA: 2'-deoxycytidine 5'-triphosphate deaminase [Actinomycetota bacterium]|nr:2'-deoxycytidine 5'-triphosphate deaminase [Actinomycetota bacterium]